MSGSPPFLEHCGPLFADYDLLLCDVWGVIHNGMESYPPACAALTRARQEGRTVMLISNSPRPAEAVLPQLDGLKVPRDCFDGMVTSGDVTSAAIMQRPGQSVFHLGPPRDLPIYQGLNVKLVDAETADYVVCSGLFDDTRETPEDYRALLERLRARNLFMICGNPDLVVERGKDLVYCAGAIADLYQSMGGEVLYAGKPYAPIYEMTLARAKELRDKELPLRRVLAIGDSVRTDLTGALSLGVDCLFLTGGIHAGEIGGEAAADGKTLKLFFEDNRMPKAVMRRLVW
jgi:HAD superfamily hydrolase (TIGR01459 family)